MVTEKQKANLRPVKTKSEARERGAAGGKASGEARRRLKTFREAALDTMTAEKRNQMIDVLEQMAIAGDLRAMEFYLKIIGQHPDQETTVDQSITIKFDGGDDYGD